MTTRPIYLGDQAWTTKEVLDLINKIKIPASTREYRQGYEDALKHLIEDLENATLAKHLGFKP